MKSLKLFAGLLFCTSLAFAEKPQLIVDTDMYTDIDSGAVALAHALADNGECDLIGVVSCTGGGSPAAGMVQLINTAYGRPNLPVGAPHRIFIGPENDKTASKSPHYRQFEAAIKARPDLAKYVRSDAAPDAVEVYRKLLAAAPDKSVVVCTIGFLTNTRLLLESGPDAISPLSGRDLVAKKVKCLWAMACKYPNGKEYNSRTDAVSSGVTFYGWPTPINFLDFDYGYGMKCGLPMAAQPNCEWNPVREVYYEAITKNIWGKKNGHPAWDEVTVLFAVRGWEKYCHGIRGRFAMVNNAGENAWEKDPNGPHLVVQEKMPRKEVVAIVDQLLAQPRKQTAGEQPDFWRSFDDGNVLCDASYGVKPQFIDCDGGKALMAYSPAWHQIGSVTSTFTVELRAKATGTANSVLFTLGRVNAPNDEALMLASESANAVKLVVVKGTQVKGTLTIPVAGAGRFHTYVLRSDKGTVTVTVDGQSVAGSVAYTHTADTLQLLGGYSMQNALPPYRHGCGTVVNNTLTIPNMENAIDDLKIYYRRVK